MNKSILIIFVVVVIVVLTVVILMILSGGPNFKQYESLKEPKIRTIPNQKMISIELKGDPNSTSGKAIAGLYGIFFKLKNNKIRQAAPRARWPLSSDTKRDDWIGVFGLPVSDNVNYLLKRGMWK